MAPASLEKKNPRTCFKKATKELNECSFQRLFAANSLPINQMYEDLEEDYWTCVVTPHWINANMFMCCCCCVGLFDVEMRSAGLQVGTEAFLLSCCNNSPRFHIRFNFSEKSAAAANARHSSATRTRLIMLMSSSKSRNTGS